jgi:hypothetical protein
MSQCLNVLRQRFLDCVLCLEQKGMLAASLFSAAASPESIMLPCATIIF